MAGSLAFARYVFATEGRDGGRLRTAGIKVGRAYYRDRWRISPHRFGRRVDDLVLDRPIFLLETQGSGATLIGRCLRRNPQVITVSGGADQWTGGDEMGIVPNRMARLPRSLWGSRSRFDISSTTFGSNHSSAFACDELFPHYRATDADFDLDDAARVRRLVREHIAVYASDHRRARFLDKTHAYIVKMPLLAAMLAGGRPLFVVVVRNPYVVCTWALERKPPSFRRDVSTDARLDLIAEHWANAYRIALEDAAAVGDATVVRFEDFLADPEGVVTSLCELAELEYDPAMVPQPGQKRPWTTLPGDRKWYPFYADDRLARTTRKQRAIVERHCGELASRLGYESCRRAAHRPVHV